MPPSLTIQNAAEAKALLTRLLTGVRCPRLDLANIEEIDTSGLQVLLLARRVGAARGVSLQLVEPAVAVLDVLEILGLTVQLEPMDPRP